MKYTYLVYKGKPTSSLEKSFPSKSTLNIWRMALMQLLFYCVLFCSNVIAQIDPTLQKKPQKLIESKTPNKVAKKKPYDVLKKNKRFDYNFLENFNNNENNWPIGDYSANDISISDGILRFRGKDFYTRKCLKSFDIDISKDFEMLVTTRWIEGESNNFDFIFGSNGSKGSVNYLSIKNNKKEFNVFANYTDGGYVTKNYLCCTISEYVNKLNNSNTLKIVRKKDTFFFYINGSLVFQRDNIELFGNDFGFQFYGKETVECSKFSLRGLKSN